MKGVVIIVNESSVKRAKPREKSYMIRDERGLYLRIDPSGGKYWILRYCENKKEHQLSLGTYPHISLKEARMKRDEIQHARSKGESPSRKTVQAPLCNSRRLYRFRSYFSTSRSIKTAMQQ
ncbi:MAG: DUF4102 domain-containing protein [Synergistaceae bacterium]|nr:DUF4102 domain-containing protein [Synergistaceae bacterium]